MFLAPGGLHGHRVAHCMAIVSCSHCVKHFHTDHQGPKNMVLVVLLTPHLVTGYCVPRSLSEECVLVIGNQAKLGPSIDTTSPKVVSAVDMPQGLGSRTKLQCPPWARQRHFAAMMPSQNIVCVVVGPSKALRGHGGITNHSLGCYLWCQWGMPTWGEINGLCNPYHITSIEAHDCRAKSSKEEMP